MNEHPRIDPSWLSERLSLLGYDSEFEQQHFQLVGRFTTEVWRLTVTPETPGQARSFILKRPYRDEDQSITLKTEAQFYSQASDVPVLSARYVGMYGNVLVIEEVRGLQQFNFQRGPTELHARVAVDQLADLHGWKWEDVAAFAWLPRIEDPSLRWKWQSDYERGWRDGREMFHSLCAGFTPIGDALVGRLAETLVPLAAPRTLLHGDAHAENLPISDSGEVAFLDWQSPHVGNPAFDLSVFTAMSYPVAERRRHEMQLVERHSARIRALGLLWPDPYSDYRYGLLRRAACIVEISRRPGFSSLPWVFQRCATAAVDHNAMELIS